MAKNFDFQQFMLQKGERVGLWIAVGLMAILVLAGGYSTIISASPTEVARVIDLKRITVENQIRDGENTSSPELTPDVAEIIKAKQVHPEQYALATANFATNPMENSKRQNPAVLGPTESQLALTRGSVTFHDVIERNGKYELGVIVAADAKTPITNAAGAKSRTELYFERLKKLYPQIQLPHMRFDLQGMNRAQILARIASNLEESPKFVLKHFPEDEAQKLLGENKAKLSKTMYPARMVVVSASFPYKEQLEAFRRALRKPSIEELIKEKDFIPQFLGINVQRRVVKKGKMKDEEGWEAVDTVLDKEKNKFHWAFYRWVLGRSVAREPEDAEQLKTVIFNKMMVMPRPELGRGEYARLKLKSIDATMAAWTRHLAKTSGKSATLDASPLNRRLSGDVDVLADKEADDNSGSSPTPVDPKSVPFVPEHCLMRFIDMTVRPGQTYEYRVRVRLNNPNFGKPKEVAYPFLAEIKELEGPWTVLDKIHIPNEFYYYAENDPPRTARMKDRVFVQVHKWLDFVPLDPASSDTTVPIADWAISDVPVFRGEYIGKVMDNTQVVMWYPAQEVFDFAISSKIRPRPYVPLGFRPPPFVPPPKVISVDFTTNPRALLVDFEGGEMPYTIKEGTRTLSKKDDAAIEVLILTEDGKLQVRNSATDMNDADRKKRHEEWAEQIKKIKEKPSTLRTSNPKDKDDPFNKKN